MAQRRYMRVDADNRLVADSLEADWNIKLRQLRQAETNYEKERHKDHEVLSDQMQKKIRSLTEDFIRLWNDPQMPHREKSALPGFYWKM